MGSLGAIPSPQLGNLELGSRDLEHVNVIFWWKYKFSPNPSSWSLTRHQSVTLGELDNELKHE